METLRIMFDHISEHDGPIKLTHKSNNHRNRVIIEMGDAVGMWGARDQAAGIAP